MDPNLKARRAAKYAGTSLFLIRLMATPLFCCLLERGLVWSEAWSAGGEEEEL
jgi:hypothetical protein